jgi:hypothetical protein
VGFFYNPSLRYGVSIHFINFLQYCFSSNFVSLNDFNETMVQSLKNVLKDITTRYCEFLTKTLNYKRYFNRNLY